jgi:septation ring formation regulator EzrA
MQPLRLLDDSNLPTIPKDFLRCLDTANNRMRAHPSVRLSYSTPHNAETAAKAVESVPEVIRCGY